MLRSLTNPSPSALLRNFCFRSPAGTGFLVTQYSDRELSKNMLLCGTAPFKRQYLIEASRLTRLLPSLLFVVMSETCGVFQYFYHCRGETLPIRDVLDTQGQGPKTEPHYENLTENWCTRCARARIRSANRNAAEYLFLVTRYVNPGSKMDGKRIVVGYLHRAKPEAWEKLNARLRRDARKYDRENPANCDFFAGDGRSHFVAAEHGCPLPVGNCRWVWKCPREEAVKIVAHLRRHPNILPELRKRVEELKKQAGLTGRIDCKAKGKSHERCKK
jgi:hypothetical protein